MGNLFIEEGLQFVSIHTKDVMDTPVVNSVQNVPKIGEEEGLFKNFVKERFVKRRKLIADPLKKNKQQKDPFKRQSRSKNLDTGLCAFLKVAHSLSKSVEMVIWKSSSIMITSHGLWASFFQMDSLRGGYRRQI